VISDKNNDNFLRRRLIIEDENTDKAHEIFEEMLQDVFLLKDGYIVDDCGYDSLEEKDKEILSGRERLDDNFELNK